MSGYYGGVGGTAPVSSVDGRTGAVTLADKYDALGAADAAADAVKMQRAKAYNGLYTPSAWGVTYAARVFTVTLATDQVASVNGEPKTVTAGTYALDAHADTTGVWFLVVNAAGQIVATSSYDFLNSAIIAYGYWNSTDADGVLFDERHPADDGWPASLHRHRHQTRGSVLVSGGNLSGITVDSNVPADIRFEIGQTVFDDESLRNTLAAFQTITDGGSDSFTVWYRSGLDAAGAWSWDTGGTLPILADSDNPGWNELTGGSWQMSYISSNNTWVNYWVIATNSISADHRYICIPGQATHANLASAQAEDFLTSIAWGTLPFQEIVPLAKLTVRRATATGLNFYIDEWASIIGTQVSLSSLASPFSHGGLSGRSDPGQHPATAISYSNATSGLTAETVQAAIDEVAAAGGDVPDEVTTDQLPLFVPGTITDTDASPRGDSFADANGAAYIYHGPTCTVEELHAHLGTVDTGVAQPTLQVYIGGVALLTSAQSFGSTANTDTNMTSAIDTANKTLAKGDRVEIFTEAGTEGDAATAFISLVRKIAEV